MNNIYFVVPSAPTLTLVPLQSLNVLQAVPAPIVGNNVILSVLPPASAISAPLASLTRDVNLTGVPRNIGIVNTQTGRTPVNPNIAPLNVGRLIRPCSSTARRDECQPGVPRKSRARNPYFLPGKTKIIRRGVQHLASLGQKEPKDASPENQPNGRSSSVTESNKDTKTLERWEGIARCYSKRYQKRYQFPTENPLGVLPTVTVTDIGNDCSEPVTDGVQLGASNESRESNKGISDESYRCRERLTPQEEKTIKRHKRYDTGGRQNFECRHCSKCCLTSDGMEGHEQRHRIIKLFKEYPCRYCNLTFRRRWTLEKHELAHVDATPHKCRHCGDVFSTRKGLKDHELANHLQVGSLNKYMCAHCGSTWPNKCRLAQHEAIHSTEKPFQCGQCPMRFRKNSFLDRHIRVKHISDKPFVCEVCGRGFIVKYEMQIHIRIHSDVKLFVCKICGKRFKRSGRLGEHMNTHTGETPYKCNLCPKSFTSTHQRFMHQARIHLKKNMKQRPRPNRNRGKKRLAHQETHLEGKTGKVTKIPATIQEKDMQYDDHPLGEIFTTADSENVTRACGFSPGKNPERTLESEPCNVPDEETGRLEGTEASWSFPDAWGECTSRRNPTERKAAHEKKTKCLTVRMKFIERKRIPGDPHSQHFTIS